MSGSSRRLLTEVVSRESHGGESRIKAARFPARKRLEKFDFTFQRLVRRQVVEHLGQLDLPPHERRFVRLAHPAPARQPSRSRSRSAPDLAPPVDCRIAMLRRALRARLSRAIPAREGVTFRPAHGSDFSTRLDAARDVQPSEWQPSRQAPAQDGGHRVLSAGEVKNAHGRATSRVPSTPPHAVNSELPSATPQSACAPAARHGSRAARCEAAMPNGRCRRAPGVGGSGRPLGTSGV
jgi:hypothetical protein